MVLGSLGRRNRQGEIRPFRDETRKSKCLQKSSAEVAFPVIPLAARPQIPRAVLLQMAEGSGHVGCTKMALPRLLHPGPPNEEVGLKARVTGWCRMHWMSAGPRFHARSFPSRNAADPLPSMKPAGPNTSHRPPVVLARL